jgi:hypothetical protein
MPVSKYGLGPKGELKRGFWWTIGAVLAYALVGAGALVAISYLGNSESAVTPLGTIESGDCASGSCPEAWAR